MTTVGLEVRRTRTRGRGVFATRRFERGQLVERSHVVVIEEGDVWGRLREYDFAFGKKSAIAFGLASLFNHSRRANLWVTTQRRALTISFWARRRIERGEELTFDYGYVPDGYDGR